MKRLLITTILLLSNIVGLHGQGSGTPSTLRVRVDANGYLIVAGAAQTSPITQGTFNTRVLKTDSTGNLLVVLAGGIPPSAYPLVIPASTCASPSLGLSGNADNGIAFTAVPSILNCIEGTAVTTLTGSSFTVTQPLLLTSGANTGRIFMNGTVLSFDNGSGGNRLYSFTGSLSVLQGSVTTNVSNIDATSTWNNGAITFTGWKLNVTDTASAAGSLLLDLQTASTSRFSVNKAGTVTTLGNISASNGFILGGNLFTNSTGTLEHNTRTKFSSPAEGLENITKNDATLGIQLNVGTAAPTCSANCAVTTGSRNTCGEVVLSGGATGATLTFGAPAFTNTPLGIILTEQQGTNTAIVTAKSTTAFTFTGATANGTVNYCVIGRI